MNCGAARITHIDFHISYKCCRKCAFCSEANRMKTSAVEFVPSGVVLDTLKQYAGDGFRSVLFTGGEPFLHPQIADILSGARALGYLIEVSTNGVAVDPELFESVAGYIHGICLSYHAHNARLFNRISHNPGGFDNFKAFIEQAKNHLGQIKFMANVVLTQLNAEFTQDIVRSVCSHGMFKLILLSNVAPEGEALRKYEKLALRLPEMADCVAKAKSFLWGGNVELHVFGMPYCVLGGNGAHSNDIFWYPRVTVELEEQGASRGEISLKQTISAAATRERARTQVCEACSCNDDRFCAGIFTKYLELYGDGELKPQ